MTNVPDHWDIDDFRDPGAMNYITSEWGFATRKYGKEAGLEARELARRGDLKLGRDNGRTPVQWTSGRNAGFSESDGECWIGVNDNCKEGINVEDQQKDEDSVWNFWKEHIQMRKSYCDIFTHGRFKVMDEENENSFTYLKTAANGETAMVVLNFSEAKEEVKIPSDVSKSKVLTYLTGNTCDPGDCYKPLAAWEGRVYLLKAPTTLAGHLPT
jgi:alpha-glucosidase